jgi:alkylation response protein AidB-like acyl-CoA dehydrogenase
MTAKTRFPRPLMREEHLAVKDSMRRFLQQEVLPHYMDWERDGITPRDIFAKMAQQGFMCLEIPEQYGGQGIADFRFNVVIAEACQEFGLMSFATGFTLTSDVTLPYFMEYTNDEQKQRWLPGLASGELITAIAMTEPGGGSDLGALKTTARREGDFYVVNGSKTFITNGINADLALTAVRTDSASKHGGISLLVIERGMEGFERGRNLEKTGNHGQDTAELFFNDVRVPVANLVGEEGKGFKYMMRNLPQERLSIACSAVAAAEAALQWTIDYVRERKAFGQSVGAFQYNRITIAEMRTEIEIGRTFLDRCVELHLSGDLSAEQAAMAKWWATDLQGRVMDRCVQLHGGYGYMTEYPIARAWADARITRIYGGTNEIMKEIIGKAEQLG